MSLGKLGKKIIISSLAALLLLSMPTVHAASKRAKEVTTDTLRDNAAELVNVALTGSVEASCTTSDNGILHKPDKINDGNESKESYWDSGISEDEVFVILDLGEEYDISNIQLMNYWGKVYSKDYDRYYKYAIYVSSDKQEWVKVAEKQTEAPATQMGENYAMAKNTVGRYVKVKCIEGNNADPSIAHIIELKVFSPAKESKGNIALHKSVVASVGNTANITNGNRNDYWDGGTGPQAFVIDLEKYYELSELHIYPYFDGKRFYHYEVYVSDNGFNYEKIAEKTTDEVETAAGKVYPIASNSVARYVKVVMLSNSVNASVHMNEMEIYGEVVEGYQPQDAVDPQDPSNIAFSKPTRANSGTAISKWVVDGDDSSAWSSFTYPSNVDIDLGKNYDISDMTLHFPVVDGRFYKYAIYTSINGIDFKRIARKSDNTTVNAQGDSYQLDGEVARIVRINIEFVSASANAVISEVRIHGTESSVPTEDRKELEISSFNESSYAEKITHEDTISEVQALVTRRLGAQYVDWFTFELTDDEKDYFEISNNGSKIKIRGNEGVSLTSGLYYYVKNYCNAQITQQTEQLATLPTQPVLVDKRVYKETDYEVRYAYNYCTLSYTNAFFGEEEWQRELDWLALNGVNLVLDITGQEAVWLDFLQNLGYTTYEAESWLVGPGYTAWQFMSNMENYGGPINDQYILDRLELARKNQYKMRKLGISPVLQGYAGMIPSDYDKVIKDRPEYKKFADAMMTQGSWGGQFNRPAMLKTNSQVFDEAAALFYASQEKLLGDISSYYAVDPFHEGGIPPSDMSTAEISEKVLKKMMEQNEKAVWIIQSWEGNPTKALLDGLGDHRGEHALILDLTSTSEPHHNNSNWGDEFYETPWVYCMLDNFGDRPGIHGELEILATAIPNAKKASNHMSGIGITPEGTKLNPVNYELLFEMAWEDEPVNVEEWLRNYVTRRYGEFNESAYQGWLKLLDSAYGASGAHWGGFNAVANYRPNSGIILGDKNTLPYDYRTFSKAVEAIMKDFDKLSDSESYLYDVAALLKQQLQNSQLTFYKNFEQAFREGDLDVFNQNANKFLASISVVDQIAATQPDDLLGTWIGRAQERSAQYDDFSKDMFEFNAKSLITTWGGYTSAKTLGDYAYRQYAGIESDYVLPRWAKYIENKRATLMNHTSHQEISYDTYFNDMWDFILSTKQYSNQTTNAQEELKRLSTVVFDNYTETTIDKEVKDDNIAVNAVIKSSTGAAGEHPITQAIDGDDSTLWVAGSAKTPSELTLDLEKETAVYRILTKFEKGPAVERGLFIDFKMETYADGKWTTQVDSKTSKTQQDFEIIFDTPMDFSKVRIVITGVDGSLYPALAEVSVYASKGILIQEASTLKIVDQTITNIPTNYTVADLKAQIYGEVGEVKVYRDGKEMNDVDTLTNDAEIRLIASGVIVDNLSIKLNIEDTKLMKSILQSAIDKAIAAEASAEFSTLAPSVKALMIATRTAAEAVYADAAATNVQCTDAWLNLANALQFLDFQANKAALLSVIEGCSHINPDEYTIGVVEYKAALADAQAVYSNPNVLQATIKAACERLEAAKAGLQKTANKTLLEIMITAVEGHIGNGDNYNKESTTWGVYILALADAKAMLVNAAATQEEVNAAISILSDAYQNIRLLPSEEQLAELNAFLAAVKGIHRGNYTSAQLAVIDEAKEKVKAMINDFDAKGFAATKTAMNQALDIIHDVAAKMPSKPENSNIHDGVNGVQPNTGDYTSVVVIVFILLLSGCVVILMQRKCNRKD